MTRRAVSYIYGLKDPRDGLIHYVGKSDCPARRKREHLEDVNCNSARVDWLGELKAVALEPEIVILATVHRDEWQEAEIHWIALGYEEGWPLVNIHRGGCGGYREPAQPDFEFMRSYIHPVLWSRFDGLSIREKDWICVETAGTMAESYLPFLHHKIQAHQYTMHSLIQDELVSIGIKVAEACVLQMTAATIPDM